MFDVRVRVPDVIRGRFHLQSNTQHKQKGVELTTKQRASYQTYLGWPRAGNGTCNLIGTFANHVGAGGGTYSRKISTET